MYFGSEHRDIIFLPIHGIDLQAHSVNTQNNNAAVFTAARTPSVTVYNYYYYSYTNFIRSFEVYDDGTTVLKCSFCFNLLNYQVVIQIATFRKLVLFTSSGESRIETYTFCPLIEKLSSLVQGTQQRVMIVLRP
jgi:hypothetical protein